MKKNNLSSVEKVSKKSKINKADIFIYILAIIAFILMVFVLVANRTQDLSAITYLFSDNNYIEDFKNDDGNNIQSEIINENIYNSLGNDNYLNNNDMKSISDYSYKDNEEKIIDNSNDIDTKSSKDKDEKSDEKIDNEDTSEKGEKSNEKIDNEVISLDDLNEIINYEKNEILDKNMESQNNDIDVLNENSYKPNIDESEGNSTKLNKMKNDIDTEKVDNKSVDNIDKDYVKQEVETQDESVINKKNNTENDSIESKGNFNKSIEYIVQKGDAIWKIAKKFNVTNKEIIDFNNIKNPDLIYPNQKINIPSNQKENESKELYEYTVEKGDAIWKIAEMYNVSTDDIISHNDLDNPDLIYPNQKINIPIGD